MKKGYRHFTTRDIKPKGWLKRQLEIQAKGLSGHLDKIWPDIADSAWIGGSRDGWERVPYWLDGFIPLAYLLEDEDMIRRCSAYVEAILAAQKPDGWLCPCEDEARGSYDLWAVFLICKVLVNDYECSGDDRIPPAVYRALRQLQQHLRTYTLHQWSAARWFECLIPIRWLYERTGEEWLMDLAITIASQGTNYRLLYEHFRDQIPKAVWCQQTHVVNAAMALKAYALLAGFIGGDADGDAEKMFGVLTQYHGTCFGLFTGDECLSGNSPLQGTELCAVVEGMYSFEQLFEATGNTKWADRLEQLAYNALPAAMSDDMWTHQYDQMVNQIACTDFGDKPPFRTNNGESNLFGLEPNFGCCTANFSQGWPKLALSAFYYQDRTIVCALPVPAVLQTTVGDVAVKIEVQTEYPFRDTVTYQVTTDGCAAFDFQIRLPSCADSAEVDGRPVKTGGLVSLGTQWNGTTVHTVRLQMSVSVSKRPSGLSFVQRGALIYSLPIAYEKIRREYTREGVQRKFPYCDYELLPRSAWQYALADTDLTYYEQEIAAVPFSSEHPPTGIEASVFSIDWGMEEGRENVCAAVPRDTRPLSQTIRRSLYPYACCKLRITEWPVAGEDPQSGRA